MGNTVGKSATLADQITAHILTHGSISIAEYMRWALYNPEKGYYESKNPIGKDGDFITAPEISQLFGELIGVWCLNAWQSLGEPSDFNLVELGPGRGTLMADLLRTAGIRRRFLDEAKIFLIEKNAMLRERQKRALPKTANVQWHKDIASLPDAPTIFVANEFFDCLPIHQLERTSEGWRERGVDVLDNGALDLVLLPDKSVEFNPERFECQAISVGDIVEVSPEREKVMRSLSNFICRHSGYALIIDYGEMCTSVGDTLQAVRHHGFVDIFETPGHSDLTSHVDFESLASSSREAGVRVYGPVTQQSFLVEMGINIRAGVGWIFQNG